MNYSYCKKDFKNEVNNRFENYLNDRNINNINQNMSKNNINFETINTQNNNQNAQNNNQNAQNIQQSKKMEYNKDDFLDEIMKIHNDVYFNPYKILEIDKNYADRHFKSLNINLWNFKKHHPDKGGDADIFKILHNLIYIYLKNIKKIYRINKYMS